MTLVQSKFPLSAVALLCAPVDRLGPQPAAGIEDIKKFLMMIVSQKDSTPYFLFPVFLQKNQRF